MPDVLSSDVLRKQFGPTELEVLWQNDESRIICTKVADDGRILELSRVVFQPEATGLFHDVHQKVLAGTSMGEAFRAAGVPFKRQVRASQRYDQRSMPTAFAQRFGTTEAPTVTDVSIMVGPENVLYADIVEVYCPEVLPWEETATAISEQVTDRLKVFGAELAALDNTA